MREAEPEFPEAGRERGAGGGQPAPPLPAAEAPLRHEPIGPVARVLGTGIAWLLGIAAASWRIDAADRARLDAVLGSREKQIVAFWHGKFIPLFPLLRGREGCVFTSRSFNGRVIAQICRRFGYDYVFIADFGGLQSWDAMVDAMRNHRRAALAVDGPLGPYHVVKRGVMELAAELGLAIIPVSIASRPRWISRKRWDRREIPWPFAAVAISVGQPIGIELDVGPSAKMTLRTDLRDTLEVLDRQAEAALAARQQGDRGSGG